MTATELLQRSQTAVNAVSAVVNPARHNTNNLPDVLLAIHVGTAGDLKVTTLAGEDVTIPAAIAVDGFLFACPVVRIWATGTTASNLLGYK